MKLAGEGKLLRIFCGESDKVGHHMLYEALMMKAREVGMAGTTVIRGIAGYGASSRIHTAKILVLSEDLPLIVEIVDTSEKIDDFIKIACQIIEDSGCGALITEERANVIKYTHAK
ncbi:MAG TPA: DUF190 domain-containing protein [Ignavibacteriales bacterium]|nr:DUF190 domain-containing protein [Ignavibacteriales bacterium]